MTYFYLGNYFEKHKCYFISNYEFLWLCSLQKIENQEKKLFSIIFTLSSNYCEVLKSIYLLILMQQKSYNIYNVFFT